MRSRGNRSKKASVDASCAINDSSVPITSLTNDQMTRLLNPLNDRTSDTPQSCNVSGLKQHTGQDDSENENFPDKTTKLRTFC
ncbi:hypothetical protein HanHA300_Chr04g0146811 [Helianthus annuus]|nr:hypothetical protein HanHA300_Chr04g0146811 [Helianthus annuus]KAJ0597927.1 hypothetical protein HanHA89_Chr04g0160171 [Helianthus annuus]KAJ0758554.1 hypothetical protein HanLR1_Chr04g0151731 [Helianthus annuus]